jgi:hypothetical protein
MAGAMVAVIVFGQASDTYAHFKLLID